MEVGHKNTGKTNGKTTHDSMHPEVPGHHFGQRVEIKEMKQDAKTFFVFFLVVFGWKAEENLSKGAGNFKICNPKPQVGKNPNWGYIYIYIYKYIFFCSGNPAPKMPETFRFGNYTAPKFNMFAPEK